MLSLLLSSLFFIIIAGFDCVSIFSIIFFTVNLLVIISNFPFLEPGDVAEDEEGGYDLDSPELVDFPKSRV